MGLTSRRPRPDLTILDLGLPDIPGAEVCREIRGWSTAPILVLSARHSDDEKAALLDLGADDYVTKPCSTLEFQARVRGAPPSSSTRQPSLTRKPQSVRLGGVNALSRLTYHSRFIKLMAARWLRTTPAGADTTSLHF